MADTRSCSACGGGTVVAELVAYAGRCEDCYNRPVRPTSCLDGLEVAPERGDRATMPPETREVGYQTAGRRPATTGRAASPVRARPTRAGRRGGS